MDDLKMNENIYDNLFCDDNNFSDNCDTESMPKNLINAFEESLGIDVFSRNHEQLTIEPFNGDYLASQYPLIAPAEDLSKFFIDNLFANQEFCLLLVDNRLDKARAIEWEKVFDDKLFHLINTDINKFHKNFKICGFQNKSSYSVKNEVSLLIFNNFIISKIKSCLKTFLDMLFVDEHYTKRRNNLDQSKQISMELPIHPKVSDYQSIFYRNNPEINRFAIYHANRPRIAQPFEQSIVLSYEKPHTDEYLDIPLDLGYLLEKIDKIEALIEL